MQFFDGLRSGQDRSLQISRQRCGGYNKVGGNKKSHHGRWWDFYTLLLIGVIHIIDFLCINRNISTIRSDFANIIACVQFGSCIFLSTINARIPRIRVLHLRNRAISIDSNVKVTIYFCKVVNILRRNHCRRNIISSSGRRTRCIAGLFAIGLRSFRLSSHNDHTGLRNNLLLVGLVNIARQSRNQQSGQDCQDDQDDDQLDEGEALFVF